MSLIENMDEERTRISLLYHLQILDSPAEEKFDRITRLLCRILSVSGASLSFIDTNREWFKSTQGFECKEVPRISSFGAQVIEKGEIVEIAVEPSDIEAEALMLASTHRGFQYFAGAPIALGNKAPIGAICIYDSEPILLDEENKTILDDFSQTVANELKAQLVQQIYRVAI